MTDKERLKLMLTYSADSLEEIVGQFLIHYITEFSPSRLRNFEKILDKFLDAKIHNYELAIENSYEKACYLKSYLEGKMWKDEKSAKANVGSQIKNTESIIYFWHMAIGKKYTEEGK